MDMVEDVALRFQKIMGDGQGLCPGIIAGVMLFVPPLNSQG